MVKKSLQMALNTLVPLLNAFIIHILFQRIYSPSVSVTLGTLGNVIGIVVAASAGCMVMSTRQASQAIGQARGHDSARAQCRQSLAQQIIYGYALGLVVVIGAVVATALLLWDGNTRPEYAVPYLAGECVLIGFLPMSQIIYGFLLAHGFEGKIFSAMVVKVALQSLGIIVVFMIHPHPAAALLAVSLVSSAASLGVDVYRLRLVSTIVGDVPSLFLRPVRPASARAFVVGCWDRMIAGIDGIFYMVVFLMAILSAARYGTTDGAAIAAIIAFMRLLIIPMKQFGLVGGRMMLSGRGIIKTFADFYRSIAPVAAVGAAAATVLALFVVPDDQKWVIALLVGLQVISEPFSGVAYGLMQVLHGPRKVFWILVVCYGVLAPALLAGFGFLGPQFGLTRGLSAVGTWCVLLSVRLVFLALVQMRVRQLGLKTAPGPG